MRNLRAEGHRVLIFSMSKKILNIIEEIIGGGYLGLDKDNHPVKYMRIDGDTEIILREQICNEFNRNPSIFCGLLTTKVGGFGLNLTGADRAVILDPDWNPANDSSSRIFKCMKMMPRNAIPINQRKKKLKLLLKVFLDVKRIMLTWSIQLM